MLQAPPAVRRDCVDDGGVRGHLVLPAVIGPCTRLVVVMHGVLRNGVEYAERWAPVATRGDRVVLVPELDGWDWPGARAYNLGNATRRGPSAFAAVERLCGIVRERLGLADPGFVLWGHSAGAQFVHRFVLFRPDAQVRLAIAAGAGWYTAPDLETRWPYGLAHRRLSFTAGDVRRWAAAPVVLMRGTLDVQRDLHLRTSKRAMAQGPNRFDRAAWMHEQIHRFDPGSLWRLVDVPGVAHDDRLMARAAWPLLDESQR
jgi:pimeloyl-ACP methyl ester carboxylesterase